jgi:hypothetical protein
MNTQPLAELNPKANQGTILASGSGIEKQKGNGLVLWGFVIMLIGAAIGIVGKKLLHEDIITVVGALISLVGMFLTVYPYLSPSRLQKNYNLPSKPEVLIASQPANYLPQGSTTEYVPSITERTTNLLKSSASGGQRENREPSGPEKLERAEHP